MPVVESWPYPFPLSGSLIPTETALVIIDMQGDFVGFQGMSAQLGANVGFLQEMITPLQRLLHACRHHGVFVVHSRETFKPDLSDMPTHRRWKGSTPSIAGDAGPLGRALVRGEAGWEIIDELAPMPDELIIDKTGYSVFSNAATHQELASRGIRNLILTGVTTDCCVQSTLRQALDLSYECVLVEDCVRASTEERHLNSLRLLRKPNGVFGTFANSDQVIACLEA